MKKIAFFDFDGTITNADTMFELIKFKFGTRRLAGSLLAISPHIVAMKLGWIPSQVAKEKLLSHFFKGLAAADFDVVCSDFVEKKLPHLIRPLAFKEISHLKNSGFQIVVVTASLSSWVAPWTKKMHIELIASEPEIINGHITGRLAGLNCINDEKVNRIKAIYDLEAYTEIYAYGDSSGDRAMLALSDRPRYRPFRL